MPTENEPGSQNPGTPNDAPKTEANQAELGNAINAAVTSHMKRLTEKTLPTMLEGAMKPLLDQIAALKAAPAPTAATDDKTKVSPEVAALTQQLADMKTKLTQEGEQRAAAEKKSRDDRAFSDLKSQLASQVRPEMLNVIASHLFHIEKSVEVDDTGNAIFKGKQTNYGITEDVAYPMKDGVEQWLKSDAAKPYLPAPGTSSTPTTQRRHIAAPTFGKDVDISKLNPTQRVQYAEELELQATAALAAQGIRI